MGSSWLDEFCTAIRNAVPSHLAEKIIEGYQTQDENDRKRFADWLDGTMARLDSMVGIDTRKLVMKQLGYNCAIQHSAHIEEKKKVDGAGGLSAFFAHAEQHPDKGVRIQRSGETVTVTYYPEEYGCRCYCAPWQAFPKDMNTSLTYCWCSAGHVEYIWRHITGKPIVVDLRCSCINGAKDCRFTFDLPAEGEQA